MAMVLRGALGLMAGAILGTILGFIIWIGGATPIIRSPVELFAVIGAAGGLFLGLRAPRGMGVGRASFAIVAMTVGGCAVVAFYVAQLLWHDFNTGMIHP